MFTVPKSQTHVQVVMSDIRERRGNLFVENETPSNVGRNRLEDLLNNAPGRFVPFETEGGEHRLLAKREIVYIRSDDLESEEMEKTYGLAPVEVKVHLSNTQAITCRVYPCMPDGQQRVSDFFNQESRFLPVYHGKWKLIVNSDHICMIED